jgi:hypothetical protein
MSSQQYYVSGDFVHPNSQVVNVIPQQQLVVNDDVFEIPDIDFSDVSKPDNSVKNIIIQQQQEKNNNNPSLNLVGSTPTYMNADSLKFIKSINQNAMTDVMNEIAKQKHKPPSISSHHTGLSIQPPKLPQLPSQPTQSLPKQVQGHTSLSGNAVSSIHQPSSQIINNTSSADDSSQVNNVTSTKKNIPKPCKNPLNKKVIVEEEDKESAVDYDDDDTEIKKTKLSLFQFAKDITFNLIFAIPFLQKARLHAMLKDHTLAINQIERIFDEFKDRLSQFELESIKKYVCEDGIRDQLNFILESGFNKILSDGVIDINDAPQFNQLVYYIIKSFNDINQGKVYRFYVSREHVMLLLHFVLKSVFSLTLKGQEEQMAIGLLDTSFKLVQLEVLPIVSKRWYHKFRICNSAKQIEDIIE